MTQDELWAFMNKLPPVVPNEFVDGAFKLGLSPIHGIGMFAIRKINKGESFAVNCYEIRSALARYTNHSNHPNSVIDFDDAEDGWLTASRDIEQGEEVTTDYNDNLEKTLKLS